MGRDRAGRVDEVDDGGVWEATEGEPEVERGASHDNQVGLPERNRTARAKHSEWSAGSRPRPMSLANVGSVTALDELAHLGFRAGPVGVTADQQDGTFRGHQQFGDSG